MPNNRIYSGDPAAESETDQSSCDDGLRIINNYYYNNNACGADIKKELEARKKKR